MDIRQAGGVRQEDKRRACDGHQGPFSARPGAARSRRNVRLQRAGKAAAPELLWLVEEQAGRRLRCGGATAFSAGALWNLVRDGKFASAKKKKALQVKKAAMCQETRQDCRALICLACRFTTAHVPCGHSGSTKNPFHRRATYALAWATHAARCKLNEVCCLGWPHLERHFASYVLSRLLRHGRVSKMSEHLGVCLCLRVCACVFVWLGGCVGVRVCLFACLCVCVRLCVCLCVWLCVSLVVCACVLVELLVCLFVSLFV